MLALEMRRKARRVTEPQFDQPHLSASLYMCVSKRLVCGWDGTGGQAQELVYAVAIGTHGSPQPYVIRSVAQ